MAQSGWFYVIGNTAFIRLTGKGQGLVARIDASDVELVANHSTSWYLDSDGYPMAHSKILNGLVSLHKVICPDDPGPGNEIDHADEDKLNATRSNLRVLSKSDNRRNVTKTAYAGHPTSSRFPGVSWDKHKNMWNARARVDGHRISLGYHEDEIGAARAYRCFLRMIAPGIERPQWRELDSAIGNFATQF